MHGQERPVTIAGVDVLLYPVYHPAAALYTPSMMRAPEADFARIPALLGRARSPARTPPAAPPIQARPREVALPVQLGLF